MKSLTFTIILVLLFSEIANSNSQWQKLNGPFGSAVMEMINHNGTIFISTNINQSPTSVMKSTNNGINWADVSQQINGPYGRNFTSIGTELFFAQDTALFMTTNNGATWVDVSGNLPFYDPITVIASHNGILFAAVYDGSGYEELFYSTTNGTTWTTTGFIAPFNDSFNQFYSDGNNFWLASGSGVYLSNDNGITWVSKSTNIPFSANVSCIIAHGDTLYCGTSNGIYFSTDGANLWMPAMGGLSAQTYGNCFAIDGNTVYMGTTNSGVVSTTLGSSVWSAVGALPNYTYVGSMATNNNELLIGLLDGFYAISLTGSTWNFRVDGLLSATIRAVYADASIILASVGNTRGVSYSTNGGLTWQPTTMGTGTFVGGIKKFGNKYFAYSFNTGLHTSADGINWTYTPINNNGVHCLVATGNKIVAGTSNGIYQSFDNGITWSSLGTGIPASSNIYDLAVSGINIYASNGSNKIYISHDAGITWKVGNGGTTFPSFCTDIEAVDGYLLAFASSVTYRSSDNGETFALASPFSIGTPYDTYSSGKNVFAALSSGVFVSDDLGKSWHQWNDGFVPFAGVVYTLGAGGTTIYAGTEAKGLWKRNYRPELYANTISGVTYCAGNAITITFNSTDTFNVGNKFYAQLSDSMGHFANPVILDSILGTSPLPILTNLPLNTPSGNYYRVRVVSTDPYVILQDNGIDFSVNDVPSIYLQPANQQTCDSSGTGFYVGAKGANIIYQWQVNTGTGVYSNLTNNTIYQGVNNELLLILSATISMNGYKYRCIISGLCAPQDTSGFGTLIISSPAPSVTLQPVDVTVCTGTATGFSINATGPSLTYKWQVDMTGSGFFTNLSNFPPYSGTTTNTLTISSATGSMNGYRYRCQLSNCKVSDEALLTVNGTPIETSVPTNIEVCDGDTAFISINISGAGITYQWQENAGSGFTTFSDSGNYSGSTTANLKIANFSSLQNGFQYQCILNGICAPFTSITTPLTVTINSNFPTINQQPTNNSVCEGKSTYFSVNVSGAIIYYQWEVKNGINWNSLSDFPPYSGSNSDTLKIDSVSLSMSTNQYRCIVSGCTPSNSATLTVNQTPVVTYSQFPALLCYNSPAITLSGGQPAGGVYYGNGINGTIFDPLIVGVGNTPVTYQYTSPVGCISSASQTITVDFCITQGISEVQIDQEEWVLYPNPASDQITIESKSGINLFTKAMLYNITGELLFKTEMENENSITLDLRQLPPGLYLVILENTDSRIAKKFIVNR